MIMTLENIAPCRIAYVRRVGAYGMGNEQAIKQLKSWASANGLLGGDSVVLGIARDDPAGTKSEDCRYDACIVVADDYRVSGEHISLGTVGGGQYAVFAFAHTAEAVGEAWLNIFSELAKRQYQPDASRPILERYKASMVKDHRCEICVPVN